MADRITRTDIVDAAIALLAKGGLSALAMRRIAAALDVQQSALYWHFDDKQHLLAAVADRVVATVGVAADGEGLRNRDSTEWPDRVTALAWSLRAALLCFPDGAELVATAIAFRLGGHQPVVRFTEVLMQSGLAVEDAEMAAVVLVHFTVGYTTDEQQYRQAALLGAVDGDAADFESSAGRFGRGLGLIVAGIAHTASRAADASDS